jgi:membrane protease YdiL (CAAX protease family)
VTEAPASPLDAYVAPARERNSWARIAIGLAIIGVGWLLSTVLILIGAGVVETMRTGSAEAAEKLILGQDGAAGPFSSFVLLATFAGVWPVLYLVVRAVHGQRFGTLFSPGERMDWRDYGRGLGLALALASAGLVGALVFVGAPARSAVSWSAALWWSLPLVLAIFAQTGAEELVFRGYLLQRLRAKTSQALIWAGLPALIFGLLHFDSTLSGAGAWLYVADTFLFGLIAAQLVARTGGLAAAMGFHMGTNALVFTTIGLEADQFGTSLWIYPVADTVGLLAVDCVLLMALAIALWYAQTRARDE